jgi:hypothetical protein
VESPSSVFSGWEVYYTVAGTSASALTGLTFVIITLMTDAQRKTTVDGVSTFSTPTVVHFTAALMISGLLSAPWPTLLWPATLLALVGAIGVSYQCRIMFNVLRFTQYNPDLEDWVWYTILPMVSYAIVLAGAIGLANAAAGAAYAPACGVALLLLIGIHNAWDVVTYITIKDPNA